MQAIPEDWELPRTQQPQPAAYAYDLDAALSSVLSLTARIPEDAFTAQLLGTERMGNAVVIGEEGLVLTIGYLVTEAEEVTLTTAGGRAIPGHVLGVDNATGFGLIQALSPLDLPALAIGGTDELVRGDSVVLAAGGGRRRALRARVETRQAFAGYWEYLLDEALFTSPAHPLWSGGAVIGPSGRLAAIASLHMEQVGDDGEAQPLNMSVPAQLLPPILHDLASGKPAGPARPWLGVLAQQADEQVVIVGVPKGGPASRAEIRRGDVIVGLQDEPVTDLADFYRRLWALGPAGVDVPLTLRREDDVFDLEVRSIDRSKLLRKPRYN